MQQRDDVFFLLLYISVLHALAILVFTRGFLLSRNELPFFSSCDDLRHGDAHCDVADDSGLHGSENVSESLHAVSSVDASRPFLRQVPLCWTPPAVKKVVILIFDALRFDFVAPSSILADNKRSWMNKLHVMQRLVTEEMPQARLFKFIADPPTTSLQRLKGLTTGSLPTFIDVGNSFGAPAIVEDNIISQLKSNGKRVIMMGDDTWVDLFPSQFSQVFPFPSFNVKDLHTVDNGVIDNLFPALHLDNWDVLIGHFLGLDHAGHIFGVESAEMLEKLDQYNNVLEDVITLLQNQSQDHGLHDKTLLLVFGDHGQTINGDHGGGTPEEVETALFAWSSRQPTHIVSQLCDSPSMSTIAPQNSLTKEEYHCISNFQQLDFAATFSAIVGIPIPYGSIGKVHPQLFGLVAGMLETSQETIPLKEEYESRGEPQMMATWLKIYSRILCLNSWQVNRYFEQYSKSSLNGFSDNDITMLHTLYKATQLFSTEGSTKASDSDAAMDMYSEKNRRYARFLDAAAALARSRWTEFDDGMMAFGVLVMFISLLIQVKAVDICSVLASSSMRARVEDYVNILPTYAMITNGFLFGLTSAGALAVITILTSAFSAGFVSLSISQFTMVFIGGTVLGTAKSYIFRGRFRLTFNKSNKMLRYLWTKWFVRLQLTGLLSVLFCCIHACSLLSNSFILREQQVITFLLVSIGLLDLRTSIQQQNKVMQALFFVVLNFIMSSLIGDTFLKEKANHTGDITRISSMSRHNHGIQLFLFGAFTVYAPLIIIGFAMFIRLWRFNLFTRWHSMSILLGLPIAYGAIFLHWLTDDLNNLQLASVSGPFQMFARLSIPRAVYAIVAFQTVVLVCSIMSSKKSSEIQQEMLYKEASLGLLAVLSSLVLLLLGRQGPIIAIIAGLEAWCLLNKLSLYTYSQECQVDKADHRSHLPVTVQWSLFAIQIFFCTGHRCTFDGLRYAAAFIGFDHFNIYRQGTLLAFDTFGASHVLPVLGLPLLISKSSPETTSSFYEFHTIKLSKVLLMFGLIRTASATFTTLCVTIQRRHLMVWGLFAPKFVFDAIGLLVTDTAVLFVFLCLTWPFV